MGGNKAGPSPTIFLQTSEVRQQGLKDTRDRAARDKQQAMKLASEPLGICLIITVFMLTAIIAPPLVIVLL